MSLVQAAFKILDQHPKTDWFDSYVILFHECSRLGLKDYSRKIFYNMVIEAIRSDESWFFEEFISDDGECSKLLKELEIFEFTQRVTEITKLRRNKKKKKEVHNRFRFETHRAFQEEKRLIFRKNAENHLCACCSDLCIRAEELADIDNKDLSSIKGLFYRALSEERRDHRQYLVSRILVRIFEKGDLHEALDLWALAQEKGVWVDSFKSEILITLFEEGITKDETLEKILKIVSVRYEENDSFIGELLPLLFKEGKFDKAVYLSSKISSAKERVFQVLAGIFDGEGFENEKLRFLEKLHKSVLHELGR